jgi:radical SAM family uncharacterized protein/radical SAM-linked protein
MSLNLSIFKKPSRYIGNEINIIHKDGDIKVALCFPDTYEIGMSHLGLKILYAIINNIPYASAERVYAPWVDFESYLRRHNLLLSSLEYQRPLKDFDIVGFTLQYELSYTNVLNMLDLGGIPIKAEERANNYPLIIAGGPCTVNPLPLVPFIDAFIIGDGEEIIKEIIETFKEFKIQNSKFKVKEELLNALSKIEGVYIPSVHDTDRQTIKRRFVKDLDRAFFPDKPIVPYTSIVHDRIAIEVARGCTRGCRFCQAGLIYRPLRERSLENVLSIARNSIASTGYEEISFTSLNTGDYSCLLPLIKTFNEYYRGANISVSLPSLRVASVNQEVLQEIKSVRKTGFTIAPEAGTTRLRNVINKDFTDEEYEETLEKLFIEGWRHVKLYFMIGLPTETMEDVNGLIDMAVQAAKKGKEITGQSVHVNVGISAFVPKPHTPFQWIGQIPIEELRERQDYIKKAFKKRRINFRGQHVEHSLLEAVFARADRDSALLLETAWRLGCRFDGWAELFNFNNWLLAARKTDINLFEYATRSFDLEEKFPWDFIDTGITKKFLQSEYQKAMNGKTTSDCKDVCCGCGLECSNRTEGTEQKIQIEKFRTLYPGNLKSRRRKIHSPVRMRIKFSKTGDMCYLSHHELMATILRAMRRANIPIAYSSGFHPHPKISFGPALAVGVEGLNEFFDVEISTFFKPEEFLEKVNQQLPPGLKLLSSYIISSKEKALNDLFSCYEYEVIIDKSLEKKINSFIQRKDCLVSRDNKTVDIRPTVKSAEVSNEKLKLFLVDTEKAKARLYEILKEMLQMTDEQLHSLRIKRIGLYGYNIR